MANARQGCEFLLGKFLHAVDPGGGIETFAECGCPRPPPSRLQRAADRSVQRGFRPRSWEQGGHVFEQLSAALVPEGTLQAEWDNFVVTNSGAKRAEAHQWLERCGITAEVADQGTEKGEIMGAWIVVDPGRGSRLLTLSQWSAESGISRWPLRKHHHRAWIWPP